MLMRHIVARGDGNEQKGEEKKNHHLSKASSLSGGMQSSQGRFLWKEGREMQTSFNLRLDHYGGGREEADLEEKGETDESVSFLPAFFSSTKISRKTRKNMRRKGEEEEEEEEEYSMLQSEQTMGRGGREKGSILMKPSLFGAVSSLPPPPTNHD